MTDSPIVDLKHEPEMVLAISRTDIPVGFFIGKMGTYSGLFIETGECAMYIGPTTWDYGSFPSWMGNECIVGYKSVQVKIGIVKVL